MDQMSVADIILAVDEPIDATQCGGKENCHGEDQKCLTHDLWASLNAHIFDYLRAISLKQLVDAQRERANDTHVIKLRERRESLARDLGAVVGLS